MRDDDWAAYGPVLSTRNLAVILNLEQAAVLLRLRKGTVPAHRVGGSWIIFTAEVQAAWEASVPGMGGVDVLAGYPDPLLSHDVARLFGKGDQTISRWLREGTIPAYRPAKQYFVSKQLLQGLLDQTSNQVNTQSHDETVEPVQEAAVAEQPPELSQPTSWLERTLAAIAAERAGN